jgi:glucosamine--fructose-6-phosphate aminotransferase (isomerizing)
MLEDTYLYREIHEQPAVLAELLERERAAIGRLVADMARRRITHCVIAGRGTSDNAGRYAQYLLGAVNGLTVGLATPSLHTVYGRPPRYEDALVIGISQSGKSPDIVSVVADARRQGALTAAITNFPDSDLGRAADHVIALHAGVEQAVAATKTYTAELAAIALLSAALAADDEMRRALDRIPAQVEATLALAPEILQRAERYRYMRVCAVIGRGYNYATAFEIALKIKELTYVVAEPYSSADFMHGPVALIEQAFPTIVVAPSGRMLPEMAAFVGSVRSRGAEVIAISDDAELLAQARTAFRLPVTAPEWLSPLLGIVPGQLFAMSLAHVRDLDVDRPRGLQKVTETR